METFLWVEQYRPKTVDDCILPQSLKNTFKEFVESGNIPNIILSGGPGVGKTTIAKAVLDEIGATYMMINGSEESGIDVLRTKIKNFASTVSLEGIVTSLLGEVTTEESLNQYFKRRLGPLEPDSVIRT